jgi:hypothetical protein
MILLRVIMQLNKQTSSKNRTSNQKSRKTFYNNFIRYIITPQCSVLQQSYIVLDILSHPSVQYYSTVILY